MRRVLAITFAILTVSFPAIGWAAIASPAPRLQASLSRTAVAAGETVELHLRTTADATEAPDLSPLEDDFEILGVSEVSRTSIVNGRYDQSREWVVRLLPLREGVSEVPAVSLGGDPATASAPQAIHRSAAPTATPGYEDQRTQGSARPVAFVEASVDQDSPYVQGQVLLRVKILSTEPIVSGRMSEVEVEGALVEQVGDDRSYKTTRGGQEYRVFERSFALFPQRSGELEIGPVAFDGLVRDDARRRNARRRRSSGSVFGGSLFAELEAMMGDDFFGPRGQPVRAQSESLVLDVRPRPADAGGRWWLPAEKVTLSEEWDADPETLTVGEQATRTLIVRALGVSRDQIPELELPEVAGLKQYREPADEQTVHTDRGLGALEAQKTVLIATEPGNYVLPEVQLEWWDTSAERLRVATLPERRIRVVAAAGDSHPATAAVAPLEIGGSRPEAPAAAAATDGGREAVRGLSSWSAAAAIAAALALAALSSFAWLRRRGRRAGDSGRSSRSDRVAKNTEASGAGVHAAERRLKRACREDDAAGALQAVRDIAATAADRLADPSLREEIERLQRARFGSAGEAWEGTALWDVYRRSSPAASGAGKRRAAPVLPSLYPSPTTH